VAKSVENKIVQDQYFRAQRVIKEMLHGVKGSKIAKPPKEKEIEAFGDKIRVRVNRVKADFGSQAPEINEV
jgi:hypothetical protein